MARVKRRRPYRSQRRQEQAAATRADILAAARQLFPDRGYAGSTIEAIADAAGVAAVTVYSTFGSKRELLAELIRDAVLGADPTPLLEQEAPRRVRAGSDQRTQVRVFAQDITQRVVRAAPLVEVLAEAARSDPESAALHRGLMQFRLNNIRAFPEALARNGSLRDGISPEDAAQTAFAVSSPEVFMLLVRHLDWDADRFAQWLERSLLALLLP